MFSVTKSVSQVIHCACEPSSSCSHILFATVTRTGNPNIERVLATPPPEISDRGSYLLVFGISALTILCAVNAVMWYRKYKAFRKEDQIEMMFY